MHLAHRHSVMSLFLTSILFLPSGSGYTDEATFEAVQAQWEQYRNSASTWTGSRTCSLSIDGKIINEYRDEIKNLNGRQICSRNFIKSISRIDTNKYYVWGANDKYSFTLSKKELKEPWLLTNVTSRTHDTDMASPIGAVHNTCDLCLSGPLGAVSDLQLIVKHPAFTVKKIALGEKETIIEFECLHPVEEKPFLPVQSGKLFLDPDNFYVIVKAVVYSKYAGNQARTECHTEYTNIVGKPKLPVAYTENTVYFQKKESDVTKKVAVQILFDLTKNNGNLSSADFTLSSFGLPEPFAEKASSANWLWLSFSAIGILLLVIAIVLTRRVRTGAV